WSRIGSWKTRHQSLYSSGPVCSDLFRHSSQLLATGADGGAKSGPTAHPATATSSAAANPRPHAAREPRKEMPATRRLRIVSNIGFPIGSREAQTRLLDHR